ncbi:MAG TPA: PAS domain S-box protein, partial [Candidatus Sulfotelmatobacter sp.]|nr:PAS domain S-box protein [Candidatus Sulfotelmatobacter sp.]
MPPFDVTEPKPAGLPPGLEMPEQLAAIAASVPGLIYSFQLHPDGAVSLPYVSAILEEVFGLRPEEVRQDARPVLALIHPEDAARVQALTDESARTLGSWQAEFRVRHPQKGEIWVEGRSVPRRLADGSTLWQGYMQDVTERKRSVAVLMESERRFREMMQNIQLIAIMLDTQGRIVFANECVLRLTGWQLAEVLGQDWFALFLPAEIAGGVKEVFVTLMQGQLAPHFENEIVTRSGERRLIAWNNTDLKDPAGRIVGVSSIGQDITEQRAAERALRESAERFRAVVESAPEGIFVETQGRFAYVNGRGASLFGAQAPAALVGQAVLERFHPENHPAIRERMRLLHLERRGVPSAEERCLRLDGRSFEAEVSAVPFEYEGHNGA